jgi:hypothetical protein
MNAGYSGTPLARKLGIRPGERVLLLGPPRDFDAAIEPLPDGARLLRRATRPVGVVIAFAIDRDSLRRRLASGLRRLEADGGLWIAWPKKLADPDTRLSFSIGQHAGLASGLVDNKVCAIDERWSALRFVVRREDRRTWPIR